MKILFLTIAPITDITARGIYTDLIRKFDSEGHEVYIITPLERRYKEKTKIVKTNNSRILRIKTLNILQTNLIEKGISTLIIEYQYILGVKKYFPEVSFDLILYSTPPITFTRLIQYIKQRDKAYSYLLLKDIFPQNAVDLKMIRQGSLIHRYFRKKEKTLYTISDQIGCMSNANVKYILEHNPELDSNKVEVNPNSSMLVKQKFTDQKKMSVRKKFGIPIDAIVYIYGGNLGKPQGIDFLIDVLSSQINKTGVFFIVAGSGTEYPKIKSWFEEKKPSNVLLLAALNKDEYDVLLQSSDIGMVFLDKRFTIPNFPSRLLAYLEFKKPVLAATDKCTDLGSIIQKNRIGFWSESGDLPSFISSIEKLSKSSKLRETMGNNGHDYLINNFTVSISFNKILNHIKLNSDI